MSAPDIQQHVYCDFAHIGRWAVKRRGQIQRILPAPVVTGHEDRPATQHHSAVQLSPASWPASHHAVLMPAGPALAPVTTAGTGALRRFCFQPRAPGCGGGSTPAATGLRRGARRVGRGMAGSPSWGLSAPLCWAFDRMSQSRRRRNVEATPVGQGWMDIRCPSGLWQPAGLVLVPPSWGRSVGSGQHEVVSGPPSRPIW